MNLADITAALQQFADQPRPLAAEDRLRQALCYDMLPQLFSQLMPERVAGVPQPDGTRAYTFVASPAFRPPTPPETIAGGMRVVVSSFCPSDMVYVIDERVRQRVLDELQRRIFCSDYELLVTGRLLPSVSMPTEPPATPSRRPAQPPTPRGASPRRAARRAHARRLAKRR